MKVASRGFDLEDRLIRFAVLVCRIVESLPSTRIGKHVAGQLIRCGTAAPPNYAEAQAGESRKDFVHKIGHRKISAKSCFFVLRLPVIRSTPGVIAI